MIRVTFIALFFIMATGCLDDEKTPPKLCQSNASIQCKGPNDCVGMQICIEDGLGYGPCTCSTLDMNTTDMSSTDMSIKPDMMSKDMTIQPDMNSDTLSLTFKADPPKVAPGGASRLSYSVYGATSCEASKDWMGTQKATDGFQMVLMSNIFVTSEFVLTCSNATESITRGVVVEVTQ